MYIAGYYLNFWHYNDIHLFCNFSNSHNALVSVITINFTFSLVWLTIIVSQITLQLYIGLNKPDVKGL